MMGNTDDTIIRRQRAMGTDATARVRVLRLTEDRSEDVAALIARAF